MKLFKLISFISLLFLTACISLTPRPYDSMEYSLSNSIVVNSTRAIHRCNNTDDKELWAYIKNINSDSLMLDEFVRNKLDSQLLIPSIDQIRTMTNQLLIRNKFSDQYCTHKLSNIQASARILSRTLGESDSFKLCDGGIKERLDLFTDSFNKSLISKDEYQELVTNIALLEKVDTNGCDQITRTKMQKDLQLVLKILPSIMGL